MKLHAHPPERGRRGTVLAAHGCCCCCCCCLHTLGGVIAAAVVSVKAGPPEARRTVRVYWLSLLATVVLGLAAAAMQESFVVALVLGALLLPVGQLNASFFTLIVSTFVPLDLRTLGQLTWKAFLWALIGAVVMLVPFLISQF